MNIAGIMKKMARCTQFNCTKKTNIKYLDFFNKKITKYEFKFIKYKFQVGITLTIF